MKHEPEAFSWKHDRERSTEVYEQWAERVWNDESINCPEIAAERDYYLGFRDGFVDYIWAGGNGEPPPVPPRHLWNVMLRSPDGKRRADLWFSGYRHGARMARSGGYRELGTIRTSLVGIEHHANGMEYPADPMAPPTPQYIEPVPQEQVMPEPPANQASSTITIPATPSILRARPMPIDEPTITTTSSAPIAKPVKKQPAAFEALGLALLPTDQPSTKSDRSLKARDGERSVIRGMKPTTSPRDRHRSGPRRDASPTESTAVELNPPVTSIPRTSGGSATNLGVELAHRPVPDIVLNRTRRDGHVVAASHSEPADARPDRSTTMAAEQPSSSSSLVEAAAAKLYCKQTEEPRLQVVAGESTRSEPTSAAVKFLTATIEPVPDASVRLPDAAVTFSQNKVTILPADNGKVERIVIAAPSSAQAGQVTPKQPVSGSIKIREATDVLERLPVKATDTTD